MHRHRADAGLDEERAEAERLPPVADVAGALRQPDRARPHEGREGGEREDGRTDPRGARRAAKQQACGDERARDQADVEPALVRGLDERVVSVEEVNQRDAGEADDGDRTDK